MIIDLSKWNEYIADDVVPGPIPSGHDVEIMQIMTADAYKDGVVDNIPSGLKTCPHSLKCRLFWRIKVDN